MLDFDTLRANSNMQQFLNMISKSEGTAGIGDNGYNVLFGGKTFTGYDTHPRVSTPFKDLNGRVRNTTAAGRYQNIGPTYDFVSKRLGITDFTPESQDKIAIQLIADNGALDDVLSGDFRSAIGKLGGVWASFPSSPYPQKTNTYESLLGGGNGGQTAPSGGTLLNALGGLDTPSNIVNSEGMIPVLPIHTPQGETLVAPTTEFEARKMNEISSLGVPQTMEENLVQILKMVSDARQNLNTDVQLLPTMEELPTIFDDDLMSIIDSETNNGN